jgi:hypothetical protein
MDGDCGAKHNCPLMSYYRSPSSQEVTRPRDVVELWIGCEFNSVSLDLKITGKVLRHVLASAHQHHVKAQTDILGGNLSAISRAETGKDNCDTKAGDSFPELLGLLD